jgi:hypothetical protein
MKQYFLKIPFLLLVVFDCGYGQVFAQNPDWPIVPNLQNFTTVGSTGSVMPGSYSTPYFASNCAQDASGNLMFYVVDEKIFDNTGALIGSTTASWRHHAKDILIIPDPNDCDARLVLTAYVDLLVGPSSGYYHWFLDVTRVSKTGSTLTVQPNVFSYTLTGNDNAFISMTISQPDINGNRRWYLVTSYAAWQFSISSSGINYVSNYLLGFIGGPTDVEISPLGDRLMWADAGNHFELYWIMLNPSSGSFLTLGNRPLSITGAYQAYGLEFIDNSNVLVSASKTSSTGVGSGVFQCTFGNPIATQVSANAAYSTSQLEKAIDGKIYAASATDLWGYNPSGGSTVTVVTSVTSNHFFNPGNFLFYSLPKQLDYENYLTVFGCPCPLDVTITGVYNVSLTESSTWIKTTGTCAIAANATVKLDADPVLGYVELKPGFSADAFQNVIFVAQAFNGCALGAPLRPSDERLEELEPAPNLGAENQNASIYPNPTNADFTLQFSMLVESEVVVTVIDLTGRSLLQTTLKQGESRRTCSLGTFPSGIYIVRASTNGKPIWTGKVVKE